MGRGRHGGVAVLLLFSCLAPACGSQAPRSVEGASPGGSRRPRPDGLLVSVAITRLGGESVLRTGPLVMDSRTVVEGEVENLPRGSDIWLALRTGSNRWILGDAPAEAEPWGSWHATGVSAVDAVPDGGAVEVVALITEQGVPNAQLTGEGLSRSSFRISKVVRATVDRSAGKKSLLPSVEITRVAGRAGVADEPTVVPGTFSVEGRAQRVGDGVWIWVLSMGATGSNEGRLLGAAKCDGAGTWDIPIVSVRPSSAATHGNAVLVGLASRKPPPPPGTTIPAANILGSVRSTPWRIMVAVPFLGIAEVADRQGGRWLLPSEVEAAAISVRSERAEVRVMADGVPDGARTWVLVRPGPAAAWLAFGPGHPVSQNEFLVDDVRVGYPRISRERPAEMMAVASSAPISGRALFGDDLADALVAASSTVLVIPPPVSPSREDVELAITHVGEHEIVTDSLRTLREGITLVRGTVFGASPDVPVSVGIEDPTTGRWTFSRAIRSDDDGWSARIAIRREGSQRADQHPARLIGILGDVTTSGSVDAGWWEPQVAVQSMPVSVLLPRAPRWTALGRLVVNQEGGGRTMTTSMRFVLLMAAIGAAAAMVLWLLRWASRRVWIFWNARSDAKRDQPPTSATTPTGFERQLMHAYEREIARIDGEHAMKKAGPKAAKQGMEDEVANELKPKYERLNGLAGGRDPHWLMDPRMAWILLVVLTIGECAFNLMSFYILHQTRIETVLIALGVCVALPVCAYFVGKRLLQPSRGQITQVVVVLIVVVVGLVMINQVRLKYIEEVTSWTRERFQETSPGAETSRGGIGLELAGAFFVFNLLVFCATVLTTYMSHDSLPGYAETHRVLIRTKRRMAKLSGKIAGLEERRKQRVAMVRASEHHDVAFYRTINSRLRTEVPPSYFAHFAQAIHTNGAPSTSGGTSPESAPKGAATSCAAPAAEPQPIAEAAKDGMTT